ncbi:MAG: HAMP domain-containing histidine kinase [candidate division Zixibacteria bacterium]|nr:HAMP domain-containing histidine kinase [candidate division Zixibacteria bacterium]
MFGDSRKLLTAVLFVVVMIVLVNIAWWIFYSRTEQLLDNQLSRRLTSVAGAAAAVIDSETADRLAFGDFSAYVRVADILENIRAVDSLSELFIIDANYNYLFTTSLEADSIYFLAELNGRYIDSLVFGSSRQTIATPSYRTGSLRLKSAFAPLLNSTGLVVAVLGVEASVDYFDALTGLKENLYYSTALSLAGGLMLGVLFLIIQRRLNRLQQHLFLSETQSYLGRLVAVVSHEIKNPLAIIRASAERLRKKQDSPESDFVIEEVDRLNDIVTGYLDFAGARPVNISQQNPEKFNLIEMIDSLTQHFHDKYPDQEIVWLKHSVPDRVNMSGHRRGLRQVLLNLLINGADACLSAQRPIEIGVSIKDRDNSVILVITDHGPGIPHKQLKHVFEPFFTTRQDGSGLGLHLSKKIIEEMNGTIVIDSQEKTGTDVTITLPKQPMR